MLVQRTWVSNCNACSWYLGRIETREAGVNALVGVGLFYLCFIYCDSFVIKQVAVVFLIEPNTTL